MSISISAQASDADKHTNDISTLLYHDGKLYSGSDDGKIKVWDYNLKLLGQAQAHPCSVYHLCVGKDTLYSCSNDGTVKSWGLGDLSPKSVLHSDEGFEMWRLYYNDGALYAGDDQGLVRKFINDKLDSVLNILEPVKDMIVDKDLLYTARDLYVVVTKLYQDKDALHFSVVKPLPGRAPFCIAGDKLCFCNRDGKELVMHANTSDHHFKEISQTKNAHNMIINSLVHVNRNGNFILFTGGWDKVVKQWKIENECIEPINNCTVDMCVTAMAPSDANHIFVGGSDGKIVRLDM